MKKNLLFLGILLALLASLSWYHYHRNIRMFPAYMHAWTQSDRYSIAIGYVDNGLNFFKPNMHNLMPNPDFVPHKAAETGITSVDFPINEYIVALGMTATGSTKPLLFRLFILLYSLTGLFFLFRLTMRHTSNPVFSFFLIIFVFTAPVFCYYQDGFLPSATAVANMFIGWFYYSHYYEKKNAKNLYAAFLFFTLAVLTRKPFLIFIASLLLYHLRRYLKSKKVSAPVLIAFASSFAAIILVALYNQFLAANYGNAFLGTLMPGESLEEYGTILKQIFVSWFHNYLTSYHYVAFGLILLSALYFIRKYKPRKGFHRILLYQALIGLLFSVIYFAAMAKQFIAHDYYFLDSFFVPLILLMIYLLATIREENVTPRIPWPVIFAVFSGLFIMQNSKIQARRYTTGPWDRVEITRQNFKGSDRFLDSLGISRDARILVIDAYTTNMPLIQMGRRGYTVLDTKPDKIRKSLEWNYDYAVIQNQYLISDIVNVYPPVFSKLRKIGDNGRISVFQKRTETTDQSLAEFLGIRKENILLADTLYTDTLPPALHWKTPGRVSRSVFLSPSVSGVLDDQTEYSTTLSLTFKEVKYQQECALLIKASVLSPQADYEGFEIVMSMDDNGKQTCYTNYSLRDYTKETTDWQTLRFLFRAPPLNKEGQELKLYFWNPKKKKMFYDDVEVILYNPR